MTHKALGLIVSWLVAGMLPLAAAQTPAREGGQLSITSDTQEANTKTGVVIARGNVRIDYPARKVIASAQQAIYYTKEKRIVLSGNVRASDHDNRITAETVTYLISEGVFRAEPKTKSEQVESVYTVTETEPQPTPSTKASK